MKINLCECTLTSFFKFLAHFSWAWWELLDSCVVLGENWWRMILPINKQARQAIICNSKGLWFLDLNCSSHCQVERLFRTAHAEVMPRLSLCPLVELSSAELSNPRIKPFLHYSFAFRHYIPGGLTSWHTIIHANSGVDSGAVPD